MNNMDDNYIYQDNLCLIKTKKYKSISLYFNFAKEYDLKTKLALDVLSRFIGEYSNAYPSKKDMTRARDMLYAANVIASLKPRANLLLFQIKYTFINPKFLQDVCEKEFLDYLDEVINNTYFSKELFAEIKRIYKDNIKRSLDIPKNYANNRTSQILACQEKAFAIYDVNHIDEIDNISLDDVKEVYRSLFKDFSLDLFVVGDYSADLIKHLKKYHSNKSFVLSKTPLRFNELNEVIEEKDVSQSCLNIVYSTGITRTDDKFYAAMLGNVLFGIVPTSLLFSVVREKLSLCYQIASIDYKNEGIFRVFTLFDQKNKDTIIEEVNKQMQRLVLKDYDDEILESARTLLIDTLMSNLDDNDAYSEYLYINKLNGIDVSLNQYAEKLKQVTKDDIAQIYKNTKHILTYMLKGSKNEEDL